MNFIFSMKTFHANSFKFELLKLKNKKKEEKKKRETQHLTRRTGRKFLSVPVRATVEILR